ncbi:hypothetical protein ACE01N_20630, partial [Saccharicrinis sp. FJH2]|uniref:hypothetical protein n=1 Tax=Saccharicrinis sp. FJH65 TaxID=3344659 RepID=UPI0035F451B0
DPYNDPIVEMLNADDNFEVTVIQLGAGDTTDLGGYDVVVAQETFGSGDAVWMPGKVLGLASIEVPFVYNKVYALRENKAFASGTAGGVAEVADSPYLVVDPANQSHALFTGMTFTDDKIMIVGETAADDGGVGTKSLQYGTDQVISGDNTLLGYQEGAEGNVTIGVNYVPAGSTIGSETTKADAVLICQNYGSIIRNWGNNLTSEGLTLWRNA